MTTTLTKVYDPTLFQGAAPYYVRYRSRYPQVLSASALVAWKQ
jgi:hypothetical protein